MSPKEETVSDIDFLFSLPLAEFTGARNALAKELKRSRREADAETVKALTKPPVSAWAVNQLYWKHRSAFNALLDAGARLGKAHVAQLAGKSADLRTAATARHESLAHLLQLADGLLKNDGHGSTPETMRRIQTTLETLSTSAARSEDYPLGRLTEDIGPVGFESLAAFLPAALRSPARNAVKEAEQKLHEARSAEDRAKENLKDAEARLLQARAAAEEAIRRVGDLNKEVEHAEKTLHKASQAVEKAQEELTRQTK
jgi:DNA repair exonuclease SbcCD ATPase subunit